jgi:hypothetical protein
VVQVKTLNPGFGKYAPPPPPPPPFLLERLCVTARSGLSMSSARASEVRDFREVTLGARVKNGVQRLDAMLSKETYYSVKRDLLKDLYTASICVRSP